MQELQRLIDNNRRWVAESTANDPDYFARMAQGQQPTFLYIGCSDSRVPAETVTGAKPGELFVHRNVANLVLPSDLNALSVIQYAIEVLDVKHVLVTGHYGCGGVKASMGAHGHGVVDNWLGNIRNVIRWHRDELKAIDDEERRFDRVVELNVLEQIRHLAQTPVVLDAWRKGTGRPQLHGLVYDLRQGLLRELVTGVDSPEAAEAMVGRSTSRLADRLPA